jgi:hypothetical protein
MAPSLLDPHDPALPNSEPLLVEFFEGGEKVAPGAQTADGRYDLF